MERVGLAFDSCVFDHRPGVGLQPGHGAANVPVDFDDLLDRGGFQEGRGYALFHAEDDTFRGGDADRSRAEFDRFEGVFDLEEAAFGGEGAGYVS